jgi:hypothetical protein
VARPSPVGIDLGAAVTVTVVDSRSFRRVSEHGVVIEVIASGQLTRLPVLDVRRHLELRNPRYVVQCAGYCVVRTAKEIVVMAP